MGRQFGTLGLDAAAAGTAEVIDCLPAAVLDNIGSVVGTGRISPDAGTENTVHVEVRAEPAVFAGTGPVDMVATRQA